MGLFLQDKTERVHWAVWKMEESLETLLALLPVRQKNWCEQEMCRFVSERRKTEWLSVRVLLYSMLGEEKQIGYSSEGKPFLTDRSAFISISHTKGYVAVILSPEAPVGIDIEQYGQRVHKVSERFIRPDEQVKAFRGDVTWSLLLHWSAKETIFKYMEEPDADLRKLRLMPFVLQENGLFQVREYVTEEQRLFPVCYRLSPDFVLTWASKPYQRNAHDR